MRTDRGSCLRTLTESSLLLLALLVGCAADGEDAVSSQESALSEPPTEDTAPIGGDVDVPIPGSEAVGPEAHGTRKPPRPGNAADLKKLAAYAEALENATILWQAQGKTDAEIDELGGQLRQEMMGDRP